MWKILQPYLLFKTFHSKTFLPFDWFRLLVWLFFPLVGFWKTWKIIFPFPILLEWEFSFDFFLLKIIRIAWILLAWNIFKWITLYDVRSLRIHSASISWGRFGFTRRRSSITERYLRNLVCASIFCLNELLHISLHNLVNFIWISKIFPGWKIYFFLSFGLDLFHLVISNLEIVCQHLQIGRSMFVFNSNKLFVFMIGEKTHWLAKLGESFSMKGQSLLNFLFRLEQRRHNYFVFETKFGDKFLR